VPGEIVERALGGRQRLDVEALEQGARTEFGPRQTGGDVVEKLEGKNLI